MASTRQLEPFDWRTMPLDGRTLIEASAGTGKTWSIGMLHLRLLLERGLAVERILVTTFTVAAAQELRERLRRRLAEAEYWLQCPSDVIEREARMSALAEYLVMHRRDDEQGALALRRVRLARADIDRAPIATIHALCQRIGRDHPLESGAGFGDERLVADEDLRCECVEDFWRKRYLDADVDADADEEALFRDGPEGLLRDLGTIAASGGRWDEPDGLADLSRRQAALRHPARIEHLRDLASRRELYGSRKTALSNRLVAIADALGGTDDPWAVVADKLDDKFEPEAIDEQQSEAAPLRLRDDPLIRELQALREPLKLHSTFVRGRVLAAAARACRDGVPQRAVRRGVATFAMLVDRIHARLSDPATGPILADRLFDAFPVALVDEFQDTDAVQYAIFDRIYRDAGGAPRGTLVMIGDPKQAIYGFRGGDIGTYLQASRHVQHRWSLAINQRSATALVAALNGLYGDRGGFGNADIDYLPVAAAGRADRKPYCIDGDGVREPLVLHLFRGDTVDGKGNTEKRVSILHERALDDCADDIAMCLADPARTIDGVRVVPGDIAVLVPTNKDVAALRRRLRERRVPCAGGGRGSVFESETADDVELLLHAVLNAEDERAARGALTTRLLGADLAALRSWIEQPASFERELERFAEWRALARSRGVLALFGAVLESRAAILLADTEGERVLTDLRHLGELLAAEEPRQQGLEGLLAWFATIRREGADDDTVASDARRLRIESDAGRVQLLTIHASKGLEYPIVYLPLAWRVQDISGSRLPKVLRYRDDEGRLHMDLGSVDFIAHRERHFGDGLDERLRLLYVAMTRAVHALHVYWVDSGCVPAGGVVDAAIAWKVPAIDIVLEAALRRLRIARGTDIEAAVRALALQLPGVVATGPFDGTIGRPSRAERSRPARAVQSPVPVVRAFEWQHSFSSIARGAVVRTGGEGRAADEALAEIPPDADAVAVDDPRILALQAMRGPRFGEAIHELFEHAPSGKPPRELIAKTLAAHGQRIASDDDDPCERVGELVDRCRSADLGGGLHLDAIVQRVAEFEFQFPVEDVPVSRLRALCAAHGFGDVVPGTLDSMQLNGMLGGFIDLVFAWDGRYHVLDYKTNWLGGGLETYTGRSLDEAMARHHYPLQALIYTVAVHRHLRQRLRGYDAMRDLGESWYLFVRAVGLAPACGIWRRRWPPALIEALDDTFAGMERAA
jgi:exodeoxyribonuclease V beta subunit